MERKMLIDAHGCFMKDTPENRAVKGAVYGYFTHHGHCTRIEPVPEPEKPKRKPRRKAAQKADVKEGK